MSNLVQHDPDDVPPRVLAGRRPEQEALAVRCDLERRAQASQREECSWGPGPEGTTASIVGHRFQLARLDVEELRG